MYRNPALIFLLKLLMKKYSGTLKTTFKSSILDKELQASQPELTMDIVALAATAVSTYFSPSTV